MIRRLIILLLIVGVFSQDSTSVANMIETNILYFKDGTSTVCQDTLYMDSNFDIIEYKLSIYAYCARLDDINHFYDIKLVDKMKFKDGTIKSNQQIINKSFKLKFLFYSIQVGLMAFLVLMAT